MSTRLRWLACALVVWLVAPAGVGPSALGAGGAAPSVDATATDRSATLYMKAGPFDPAREAPPLPAGLGGPLWPGAFAPASDGAVRFILQFAAGEVNPDLIGTLRAGGIVFERYLPDGGMIVSAAPARVPGRAADVGARAMLPLYPGFKIDPSLWKMALDARGGSVRAAALVWETPGALTALAAHGNLVAFDGRMAVVDVAASAIVPLVREGDVEWVEPFIPPAPLNNYLSRTVAARQDVDGPFLPGGPAVWAYDGATDSFPGLNGSGVTINIADTGIDATHPTFEGRIVAAFGYGDNATCDCNPSMYPHGTLVAGVAAGNGSWRPQDENRTMAKYAGVAPMAGLVAQVIFGSIRTPAQYSQDAYSAGAFVNSNSWGGNVGGAYTGDSQQYDELVVDANGREPGSPQMVYVFASGNSGPGPYSVNTPGTGKNVITVGATGNGRWSSADDIAGFSSRGPTADGRLKPDLVAPGDGVDSARAQSGGCGGGEDNCSYWINSGTSLSTPAVAGAAALVTQWYGQRMGGLPSAALVKAVLIGGATPLPGYDWPDYNQGWGRLNVARSVNEGPGFRHLMWDEGVALAQVAGRTTANFSFLAEAGEELRIVLVWSDVPGTSSSSKALINDLDLEVLAPDGSRFVGNGFSGGYSATGIARDTGNNTEVVRVRAPVRGVWNMTVRAAAIPSGEQKFAVVASGNVTGNWVSLVPGTPGFEPTSPREDDPLTVIAPVHNTGTVYSSRCNVTGTLEGPEGNVSQTVEILGVRPGDDLPVVFSFAPGRGDHTFRVAVDPGGVSGDAVTTDNAAQVAVFVQGYSVGLASLKNASSLPPLGSDTVLLRLTNLGNVVDTLRITTSATPGWGLNLNVSARVLEPGASTFIAGTVTAPDRALLGEIGRFAFTAASSGNSSRAASVQMEVAVAPAPTSRVVQGSVSVPIDGGGSAALRFELENSGNVPLHVNVSSSFSPAAFGWEVSPAASAYEVPPYTAMNRTVTVSAPIHAVALEVKAVRVRVETMEDGSAAELVFQVTVRRTTGLSVETTVTAQSGAPGSELSYPIAVRNAGNGRESMTVAVLPLSGGPSGVSFDADNATLTVDPLGVSYLTVSALLSRSAQAGTAAARVLLSTSGGSALTVNVSAQVVAVHVVTLEGPPRLELRQGSAAVAVVTLGNDGNLDERVGLILDAAAAGVVVEGWEGTLTLARGERRSIQVRLTASDQAPPGSTEIRLSARADDGVAFAPLTLEMPLEVREGAHGSTLAPALPAGVVVGLVALTALGLRWRRR